MKLDASKVRAARAFLNWGQKDLAERSGISHMAITNLEQDKTEPHTETLERIQNAFELAGVVFTARGVERKEDTLTILEGEGWFLRLLDDIYFTLMDKENAEMLIECGDERQSSKEVINRIRKIRNAGIKTRVLVEEGNTHLMGPLNEYRYIPKQYFTNDVSIIYDDKFAICTEGSTKAIVFKDPLLSRTRRNIFNLLWENLNKPKASTVHERY